MGMQGQPSSTKFSLLVVSAFAACHVAGLIFLPAMPLVMGALVKDFAADPAWLGRIASLQLITTALGAFCFSLLGRRINCRTLVILALAGEVLINIATANADGVFSLLILRGFSGFFQGTLLAAAGAGAALSNRTEKTFALYNIALAVFAVVVLIFGARVVPEYGNAGVFGLIICVDILALAIVIRQFPTFRLVRKEGNAPPLAIHTIPGAYRVLLALGLFGIALSGTQTFMERLGFYHGSTLDVMANALALGWCIAIFSPFILLLYCHARRRITVLLLVAYAGIATLALMLSYAPSSQVYLVAMALFTPVIMFIEPLQFGVLGRLDGSGRLAALGPAAISIGCGAGPIVTSIMVSRFSLLAVGIFACALFVMSFLLLFPASQSSRVRAKAKTPLYSATNK